jgi:hypothetical protein
MNRESLAQWLEERKGEWNSEHGTRNSCAALALRLGKPYACRDAGRPEPGFAQASRAVPFRVRCSVF